MGKVRRIIKTGLVSLAAVVAVVVLLLGGLVAYASIDKEDTFMLANSDFDDANYLRQIEPPIGGSGFTRSEHIPIYVHRLKRGSGTVFAYRFYSNGDFGTIDDEICRKATVWIRGAPPSSQIEVPLGDESKCLLAFSHCGSAWPESGCSGYGTSGTVKVEPTGRDFTVTIHGEITPAGNGRVRSRCQMERVDLTFKAKEIRFESLTPWLGTAGHHPYDETYRQP